MIRCGQYRHGQWKVGNQAPAPLPQLSKETAKADSFNEVRTSLMSVGKTNNYDNDSVFTKDGVTVHKKEDVLIMCKGVPILIGYHMSEGGITYH